MYSAMTPIFIDTDNALGSPTGDVDDAYAIAALVRSGVAIGAISSVAGNTSEPRAFENNRRLADLLGWHGPLLHGGSEARAALATFEGRVAALGPLTNVIAATHASEIVLVGANASSRGRWPPWWPHEFNLTKDVRATRELFRSDVPLTIFPLDVARQLWITRRDLDAINGPLGDYLRTGSARWFRHLLLVRRTRRFAIYDLAAALYLLDADGFTMEHTTAAMRPNTFIEFGAGSREVKVCRALDRVRLWQRFLEECGRLVRTL
jgi:inosine-uridine nucleoside N-ribohydrolase